MNGARGWLARYAALFRAAWLADLQYRAAIGIWLILGVAQPLITLAIWWAIAGEGDVSGFDRADFAQYFFAVILVGQLTIAWDIWYIDRWIREGEMNHRLTRPFNPVHEAIANNLAFKAPTATIIALIWAATALVWPPARLPLDPVRWLAAIPAIVLAAALRFLTSYVHGLLAFWTTRASGLFELHFGISLFLSGRIAPLALLPQALAAVAAVTWFPYMLAFPVEVLTGAVDLGRDYFIGLGWQAAWTLAWLAAYRVVWTRGILRYGAVGG